MSVPYERILLATEHGEFDAGAERVAFGLASRWGVPLAAVLPLVTNAEYEAVAPALAERADRDAHERLERLAAAARAAGATLDTAVRRDAEAWRAIVAETLERRAGLVIARRRGRTGFLAQRLVGDIVGRVAMQAPCDVLLVPRAAAAWSRGVLAAVDDAATAAAVASAAAARRAASGRFIGDLRDGMTRDYARTRRAAASPAGRTGRPHDRPGKPGEHEVRKRRVATGSRGYDPSP